MKKKESKYRVLKHYPNLDFMFWMDGTTQPMMAITHNDFDNSQLIFDSAYYFGTLIAKWCKKEGKEGKKYQEFLRSLFHGFSNELSE